MKLSVVIVNFNVRSYLNLCIFSLRESLKGIDAEIWVYDNASIDGSKELFSSSDFEDIHYIYGDKNIGFGKANNIIFPNTSGEYILILNPDTIVSPKAISGCVDFLDTHAQAAAVGVHMLDGAGTFLKESKRGFPTPWVSFCKLSGLIRIFPSSKLFSGYYLGHLDEESTHQIPILSGAYMMVRRENLFNAGLFDERYFMFGEDIDLSFSLLHDGSTNYYLPLRIIHFKGESTKQVSMEYQKAFFGAMALFYQKYYPNSSRVFIGVLKLILNLLSRLSFMKKNQRKRYTHFSDRTHHTTWRIGDSSFEELINRIEKNKGGISFLDLEKQH